MSHRSYSRILLLGLAVVIAITGFSVVATGSVAAQQVDVGASDLSGEGTIDDPYVITNASELQAMEDDLDAHYELGTDIDAAETATWNDGKGFDPVGEAPFSDNEFTGSLNGSDHSISSLIIKRPNENFVGIIGSTLPPSFSTENQGVITRLAVSNATITGNNYVGGIVGSNLGKINKSYVVGSVSGNNSVGGLAGENMGEYNNGIITTSYAAVAVKGNNTVGGLSGETWNGAPEPESSFWDINASGQQTSAGGIGLTTDQMTGVAAETNMTGLDFEDTWTTTDEYPALRGLSEPGSADIVVATDGTGDYTSIQNAVDNATDGDRIKVESGKYEESVDIYKNITLSAPNGATISNSTNLGSTHGLRIYGHSTVSGFTLNDWKWGINSASSSSDWVVEEITITDSYQGITTYDSSGNWEIWDTTIRNASIDGITTQLVSGNPVIQNTTFTNVVDAIDSGRSTGNISITSVEVQNYSATAIDGENTSGQLIINNAKIIDGNYGEGILLDTAASDVLIKNTYISSPGENGIKAEISDVQLEAKNLTVLNTDGHAIDGLRTSGDWKIRDLHIRNSGSDGIYAGVSHGSWVLSDSVINVTDSEGVNADSSTGNWTVRNTIVRYTEGIEAPDSTGKWGITDSRILNRKGSSDVPVFAENTTGNWTVRDTFVQRGAVGIHAGESLGNFTIRNTIIKDVSNGIFISGSHKNWNIISADIDNASKGIHVDSKSGIISNVSINDTRKGASFYNSNSDWQIRGSSITNSTTGIDAATATGDWSVNNTMIYANNRGIEAGGATGDWNIKKSTVTADTAVPARDTTGNWTITQSILTHGSDEAINATDAQIQGNASYNYWGAADGPSGDFAGSGSAAYGNVSVNPYYTDEALTTLGTVGQSGDEDRPDTATANVTSESVTIPPGGNGTIPFNLTNTGDTDRSYILNVSLPSNVTAVTYSDAGGDRQANESKWLWQTIEPNESVTPSVTIHVPPNSTNYTVDASVLTNESVVATTNTTITTGPVSVSEALDANGNNELDDTEILTAIDYWQTDKAVPGTDGEEISDFEILELIETWRDNRAV